MNPWSFLKGVKAIDPRISELEKKSYRQRQQGNLTGSLSVNPEGGFSFFKPRSDRELEIVFHNRILNAPHFQPDPLGVTAILGEQRILTYGNYHRDNRAAKDFNTVLVSDARGYSTIVLPRKGSLRQRIVPSGGEILNFGSFPELSYITARHKAYPGVTHTRTVARIGPSYLLVWDRLESATERQYTQTFHFPVPARIETRGERR
jgi:hypothetical protein